MSAAFTKGPWHALDIGEVVASDRDGLPSERVVCTVAGSEMEPENEANARLIAAAPELYEALDTITSLAKGLVGSAYINDAETALAKARGEAL